VNPLALIPLKAWLASGATLLAAFICWRVYDGIYDRGASDATRGIEQSNDKARSKADEAGRTVENCTGIWDRARCLCLPNGSPGNRPCGVIADSLMNVRGATSAGTRRIDIHFEHGVAAGCWERQ
jgi:hypothetical protein